MHKIYMQDLRKVGPRSPKEFRIIACIEGNKKILLQGKIKSHTHDPWGLAFDISNQQILNF